MHVEVIVQEEIKRSKMQNNLQSCLVHGQLSKVYMRLVQFPIWTLFKNIHVFWTWTIFKNFVLENFKAIES